MNIPAGAYAIVAVIVLLLLFFAWNHIRQRRLIRRLQDLAISL